jgi:hypothetical protein
VPPQKNTEISPLFKADSATRAFYGLKDGKITVNLSGWSKTGLRQLPPTNFVRQSHWELQFGRGFLPLTSPIDDRGPDPRGSSMATPYPIPLQ